MPLSVFELQRASTISSPGFWRTVGATAKVTSLHLHDLRAEFAAQVHESGVAMHVFLDALGP